MDVYRWVLDMRFNGWVDGAGLRLLLVRELYTSNLRPVPPAGACGGELRPGVSSPCVLLVSLLFFFSDAISSLYL
jgi:hypothetical protein